MASGAGVRLDRDIFSCPICLDTLEDPVTVPCGHNYCLSCIEAYWDTKEADQAYACPQCRAAFAPRPALLKNTTLAAVVEQLKKVDLREAPAARHREAGESSPESCGEEGGGGAAAPPMEHEPEEPREDVCSMARRSCRTDGGLICRPRSEDGPRSHDAGSAAKERRAKQRTLTARRRAVREMIQHRRDEVAVLHQRAEVVACAADKAFADGHRILTRAVGLLEGQRRALEGRLRSRQDAEEGRVRGAQEALEREIAELRGREDELEGVLATRDDERFLRRLASLAPLGLRARPAPFHDPSPGYFEDVTAALTRIHDRLQKVVQEEMEKIS